VRKPNRTRSTDGFSDKGLGVGTSPSPAGEWLPTGTQPGIGPRPTSCPGGLSYRGKPTLRATPALATAVLVIPRAVAFFPFGETTGVHGLAGAAQDVRSTRSMQPEVKLDVWTRWCFLGWQSSKQTGIVQRETGRSVHAGPATAKQGTLDRARFRVRPRISVPKIGVGAPGWQGTRRAHTRCGM
jgi:hypothetical protein